jgi:adenylate kinase
MIGAPGAGKGTQARVLSERLGLPHVASGDLFRDQMAGDTALGEELRSYVSRGALVPDELSTRVVLHRLKQDDARNGVILDGFPRTRPQAEALDVALAGAPVAAALYIEVGNEELLHRLSGRWVCRANGHVYHEVFNPPAVAGVCDADGSELYQREDDQPETVRARLEQQLRPMYEVVDYYRDRGVLRAIDGERPIDEVTAALLALLTGRQGSDGGTGDSGRASDTLGDTAGFPTPGSEQSSSRSAASAAGASVAAH